MQSDACAEKPEGSGSHPTLADRLMQDEYFTDREDERADPPAGRWLTHPGRWLNHLFGRFGPRAGGQSALEVDPLLEFAPEVQINQDRFKRKARTAPSRTRSGRGWAH